MSTSGWGGVVAVLAVGVVLVTGCGGGGSVDATDDQTIEAERPVVAEGVFPIEGGAVSDDGGDAFFVAGGFLPGSYDSPREARASSTVYLVDARSEVRRSWDLDVSVGRQLFGARVVADGEGWVVGGSECDVLTGAESPAGCIGGAPRLWRLLSDGTVAAVPPSDQLAEHDGDGPVGAGILTVLGADAGHALVTLQIGPSSDPGTAVAEAYRIDLESGAATLLTLPSVLLAPGQVCVRPDGDLWFVEPVLREGGLGYEGARLHHGQADGGVVRWREIVSFDIETSFDTNPVLTCSDDQGVLVLPSASEIYVVGAEGRLLARHRSDGAQIAGVTLLDDGLYVGSRDRVGETVLIEISRIAEDGALEGVGRHEAGGAQLPIPVDLDGQLFDAGRLVATGLDPGTEPALVGL